MTDAEKLAAIAAVIEDRSWIPTDVIQNILINQREDIMARHPGTQHLIDLFEYQHLPAHLQDVSKQLAEVAAELVGLLKDGPELTAGLRKLLEAKDCFVRQAVIDARR